MLFMGAEKRVELRIKSKGRLALLAPGTEPIVATICNVSPSGIGLEAERGLEVGTIVQLDSDAVEASGVVRFCAAQNGVYRIGVAIEPVN
jgi:hypothetical protein